jgi:predicted nicotinamide N-methyase
MNGFYYRAVPYKILGIDLNIPDPEQVRTAYESGENKEFPYWSRIWPSALALSVMLQEQPQLVKGKHVLELGAGLGLPAFISSSYASTVTVSDYASEAIDWLNLNISRLGLANVSTRLFNWKDRPLPNADVVLLSDIGYDEKDFPDIRDMIGEYVHSGSLILLSIPFRMISTQFVSLVEEFIVLRQVTTVMETEILLLGLGSIDFPSLLQTQNN